MRLISIEGNIGSGKSTLLENLKEAYKNNPNVIFVKEPVDDWEKICDENGQTMLAKFYEDKTKYSFSFQMMAYISRLALLKQVIQENPHAVIISERSLNTDKEVFAKMLYDTGFIESVNFKIYMNWFNCFIQDCPLERVIYVQAAPEICFNRIKRRLRTGESNIPLDYLQACHAYHEKMLDKSLHTCVCSEQLILNGDLDIYDNNGHIMSQWLADIDSFLFQM